MLALRDQENLVHNHQTVAASKTMNQGLRHLQPKTPGARAPKTPFKIPLNDENDPLAFGKKTVKGAGKHKESIKDAFMTPLADPRQRAPLGMKTTNTKARGLQTPAPPGGTAKPEKSLKRGSTQRVKKFSPFIEQAQPETHTKHVQDDVPDIEYMPPKPKDLPDYPEEITYDTTFPQFQGRNLARGLESVYGADNEIGPDGLTRRERKFQKDSAACDKLIDDMILKQVESIGLEEPSETEKLEEPAVEETVKRRVGTRRTRATAGLTKSTSNVSTVRARDAATALSGTYRSVPRTRSAALAKPRTRMTTSLFPTKTSRAPDNPSSMHHTAAEANSKTTLGYTRGREVSTKMSSRTATPVEQDPAPKGILSPETYLHPSGTLSSVDGLPILVAEEDLPIYGEDVEAQDFQLTL